MKLRVASTFLSIACFAAACSGGSGDPANPFPGPASSSTSSTTPASDGGAVAESGSALPEAGTQPDAGAQDASTEADGGVCMLQFDFSDLSPTCNTCAGTNCCKEVNQCASDPDRGNQLGCAGYTQCYLSCQDPDTLNMLGLTAEACLAQMCSANAAPGTEAMFNAWNTCLDTHCSTQCGSP